MLDKVDEKVTKAKLSVEREQTAVLDAQFCLLDLMAEKGVSKTELARRLGVSKSSVSQIFGAHANPTIRQLARIFSVLDETLNVSAIARKSETLECFPLSAPIRVSRPIPARVLRIQHKWTGEVAAANENEWAHFDRAAA